MSATTAASGTTMEKGPSAFFKTRLGSFLAVFPLAFWTVNHLWNNLASLRGAEAWEAAVTHHSSPFAEGLGALVALAPILIHTVWGLARLGQWRPNIGSYSYYGNVKFILQRLSAVGVLLFLAAHIYLAWIKPHVFEGHGEEFEDIAKEMFTSADGPTLIVYLLGTLGVSYHLANGLQTWAMGWGVVGSREAVKKFEWVSLTSFALLLAMSWGAIYGLYTGGREIVAKEKAAAAAPAQPR
jgi:succinate dehydrogenase / fumarate reductase cytochrome b subunit